MRYDIGRMAESHHGTTYYLLTYLLCLVVLLRVERQLIRAESRRAAIMSYSYSVTATGAGRVGALHMCSFLFLW